MLEKKKIAMNQTKSSAHHKLIWLMPVIFIFFAGGSLQYFGVLSVTQSNWIALALLSGVFFGVSGWRQGGKEAPLFIFIILIFVDFLYRGGPLSYTLTYLYYLVCAVIGAVSGREYASKIARTLKVEKFAKILQIFLLIELAVVALQKTFTETFIGISRINIGYIDAIFGTLFVQSDAGLATICILAVSSAFFLKFRAIDQLVISILAASIVFMTNSDTSKVSFVFVSFCLFSYLLYIRLGVLKYLANGFLVLSISVLLYIGYESFFALSDNFLRQAAVDYYRMHPGGDASRFSPLGQIFSEGLSLFGNGALTYYNPITKEWLYNSGFGTFYCLYIDFGLIGFSLYFIYQIILIIILTKNYIEAIIFSSIFIFFMFFNFALTDLAFTFSFNFFLNLNYLRGRSNRLRRRTRHPQSPLALIDRR